MIQKPEWFGLVEGSLPAKISFLTVGVWWIGFSQITFMHMPDSQKKGKISHRYLLNGYREIRKVWNSLIQLPDLKKYLRSFFFYNTGVQTIMYLAASFGDKELKLSGGKLILTVLIIQIVAIFGSILFARVSKLKGNKISLATMIVIWIGVCVMAYYVQNANQFYALAFAVGLVMGGIQSLSRATYSKLIPSNTIDNASYFSFYNVTLNLSTVLGTFAFGFIEQLTGSMRDSALALGSFFIIGLVLLYYVSIPKNIEESYKVSFDNAV
jgi:UMF1 family MFS transporter